MKAILRMSLLVLVTLCVAVSTANAGALVKTQIPVIGPNEPIIVIFNGLPGSAQDWITVVESSKPDNSSGQFFYTKGQKNGTLNFNGLPAGSYEVRVFFDWPAGGYAVQDRHSFLVQPVQGGGIVWTQKPVYGPSEQIIVEFSRLPGNPQDWITVVGASVPDGQYAQHFFTNGKQAGALTFNGLNPGSYEVRLFYNWPAEGYKVQFRYPFIVQ